MPLPCTILDTTGCLTILVGPKGQKHPHYRRKFPRYQIRDNLWWKVLLLERQSVQSVFMRATDAADILGVHPRTVVRLVARGEISGIRLGGLTLVRRTAIERLVSETTDSTLQPDSPGGNQ
jgi:excisionase family DNA binding protein